MKKHCKFCKKSFNSIYGPQKYCGRACYYKSKFIIKKPCKIFNCVYRGPAKAFGLCATHYIINRNHGSPYFKVRNPKGSGCTTSGYKIIRINGKHFREHRVIMENHLGRKLSKNEVIHHKNGNGLDNRINNLEVLERGKHTSHHNYDRWNTLGKTSFNR